MDRPAADTNGAVEVAYRYIRSAIVSGDLRSGDKLQESKLAERIGVSRTPAPPSGKP
jgi:DNA-binding GntR family transcriptional regulator